MSIISASVLKAFQNKQANDSVIREVKTLENYVESLPSGSDEQLIGVGHIAETVASMELRKGMNKLMVGFKSIHNTLRLKGDPNAETLNQLSELLADQVRKTQEWVENPSLRKTDDVDIETVIGRDAKAFMDRNLVGLKQVG